MSPELLATLDRLIQEGTLSNVAIGKKIGVSEATVRRRRAALARQAPPQEATSGPVTPAPAPVRPRERRVSIAVYIPMRLVAELDRRAAAEQTSVSEILTRLLERAL